MRYLIVCAVVLGLAGVSFADTWTVDDDGPADFDTIQAALNAASDGDEIVVMPGTYIRSSAPVISIYKAVWLRSSQGPQVTIIDGEFSRACIYIDMEYGVIIEGFTFTNGYYGSAQGSGGMHIYESNAAVTNCIFHNNQSASGGGVFNWNSSPTLTNCTFNNNSGGGYGGGGMQSAGDSSPALTNCHFFNNTAPGNKGGGLYIASGDATLANCLFIGNSADYGGGIYCSNSHTTISNCMIRTNTASTEGGGIYSYPGSGSPTLVDTTVCGNWGSWSQPDQISGDYKDLGGNAIGEECDPATWSVDDDDEADFYNIQDAVTVASDGDEIVVMPGTYTSTGNQIVNMLGKAVWLRSSQGPQVTRIDGEGIRGGIGCADGESSNTIIEGFTIINCNAAWGGGMYNESSSPTVTNCSFTGNSALDVGGGMYNSDSSPTVTNCSFTGNSALDVGGGMYNSDSSPTVTNCSFTSNSARNGGGLYNHDGSHPTLTECNFTNNAANYFDIVDTGYGGAILNVGSSPQFINCVISDNLAESWGGGLCNRDGSHPDFDGCTISGNIAGFNGGGMYNAASTAWISNTVFCQNAPDHIYGVWVDLEGNSFSEDCEAEPALCVSDTNLDYNVDVLDLLYVIAVWNTDNPAGDINEDGLVDVMDLLEVIASWGGCP